MEITLMKSNGNGEKVLNIPIAVITIIVMILIASVPFVVAWGVLSEKVNSLEKEWDAAGPEHTEIINKMDERIDSLEQIASGTQVCLTNIQEDITEIKSDVKELRKELG